MKTGHELKEEGIARVAENSRHFQEVAESVIMELALKEPAITFTAEDVRERLFSIGWAPPHPNAMGAAMRIASIRGIIEIAGFRSAERRTAHARTLTLWAGVRRGA